MCTEEENKAFFDALYGRASDGSEDSPTVDEIGPGKWIVSLPVRRSHPADKYTIAALRKISVNGSFT